MKHRTGSAAKSAGATKRAAKPRRAAPSPKRSSFWIVRVLLGHVRLWLSMAIGVLVFVGLPGGPLIDGQWTALTRMLTGWDVGIFVYLAAAATMMIRSTAADIEQHSDAQDEGAFAIMILTTTAAVASLGAIFLELAERDAGAAGARPYVLAIGTVVLSWSFTHLMFALHYAYEYYGDGERARGLDFPETDEPDYWDFLYFSLVIGMTFQVSDVAITNRWIRHSATAHSVLAFFFNTAVIALTVNMAANAF